MSSVCGVVVAIAESGNVVVSVEPAGPESDTAPPSKLDGNGEADVVVVVVKNDVEVEEVVGRFVVVVVVDDIDTGVVVVVDVGGLVVRVRVELVIRVVVGASVANMNEKFALGFAAVQLASGRLEQKQRDGAKAQLKQVSVRRQYWFAMLSAGTAPIKVVFARLKYARSGSDQMPAGTLPFTPVPLRILPRNPQVSLAKTT